MSSPSESLPARKNAKADWNLGAEDAERLFAEASEHKGESLWQDAWRRLKRNKSAWYSLLFLIGFALVSFLAPLLPIPSPSVLNLKRQLESPTAPWTEFGNQGFSKAVDAPPAAEGETAIATPTRVPFDFSAGPGGRSRDVESAYWPSLSGLDRMLLRARVSIFGTWQTGSWFGTDSKDAISCRASSGAAARRFWSRSRLRPAACSSASPTAPSRATWAGESTT